MKIVRPDAVELSVADQEFCFALGRYGSKVTIVRLEELKLRWMVDEVGGLGVLGYSSCCLLWVSA